MMRAFSTPLLAALTLAAAVAPAAAAAPAVKHAPAGAAAAPSGGGVDSDVRCLMTMIAFGQDKTRQQAGQIGVYFFSGRISARAPGLDLAAAMKAEAPKLGQAELQAELQRCGPMVAASSTKLQAALVSLRPPGPPPPAAAPSAAPAPTPTPAPAPAAPAPKTPAPATAAPK
jgi:pyruvate dehydrogenase E2 component (dihydrolipoamide acetyltransferase)